MTAITAPGIYTGFDVEAYHLDPCPTPSLTQSVAKILIEKSPAHAAAKHPRLSPIEEADDDTPEKYDAAKAIGDAAHFLLIGRGKSLAVGDFPAWQSKDAKAFRGDAIAAKQTPILAKHYRRAGVVAARAREHLDREGWTDDFRVGHGEVVLAWQEPDGIWCRALVDWMVSPTLICDFKTTSMSVAPTAQGMLLANGGWEIQAAFIERGLDILHPETAGRRKFHYLAGENDEPFAFAAIEIRESVLTMGRKRVEFALARWRDALKSGDWAAYPGVHRPEYPGHKERQWLDREIAESDTRRSRMIPSLMGG